MDPWAGTIPWRREWQPTPVFLPEESHRQRSLMGYSPQGHKELDMTERLTLLLSYVCISQSVCCTPETNTSSIICRYKIKKV